jgi:hypothetical protein
MSVFETYIPKPLLLNHLIGLFYRSVLPPYSVSPLFILPFMRLFTNPVENGHARAAFKDSSLAG